MKIEKKEFGKTKNGELVTEYILTNDNNFQVNIINFGGIIKNIFMPDKDGKIENIVCGYNRIEDYEINSPYYGAIIGRTAGRIAGAKFELEGETYTLTKNDNNNSLHGGTTGFNRVMWSVTEINEKDIIGLDLTYTSKDNEEGYPGNLNLNVKYLINNENRIEIFYKAVTDKTTLVNLTNHTYFNLSGDLKENIYNHKLKLNSNKVIEVDEYVMPTGNIIDVKNTTFDLRNMKKLGDQLSNDELKPWAGYDHPFLLDKDKKAAACLEHVATGRAVIAESNQPCVVFYSGNQTKGQKAYDKEKIDIHMGLCLEFQIAPGNNDEIVLKPNETYKNYSMYKFYNL